MLISTLTRLHQIVAVALRLLGDGSNAASLDLLICFAKSRSWEETNDHMNYINPSVLYDLTFWLVSVPGGGICEASFQMSVELKQVSRLMLLSISTIC